MPPPNPNEWKHGLLDFRGDDIDCRSLPDFKEKYRVPVSGSKGGLIYAQLDAGFIDIPINLNMDDNGWNYYGDINIVGYLGGLRSILARGASGDRFTNINFLINPTESPDAPFVQYRWDSNDGEVWDEIAVEVREMTAGTAAQPTFNGGQVVTSNLILKLSVKGRAW